MIKTRNRAELEDVTQEIHMLSHRSFVILKKVKKKLIGPTPLSGCTTPIWTIWSFITLVNIWISTLWFSCYVFIRTQTNKQTNKHSSAWRGTSPFLARLGFICRCACVSPRWCSTFALLLNGSTLTAEELSLVLNVSHELIKTPPAHTPTHAQIRALNLKHYILNYNISCCVNLTGCTL